MMRFSEYDPAIAVHFVGQFEGCSLTAYRCPAGVLTIGFGHTGNDVYEGEAITQDEADALLADDLTTFARQIAPLVDVKVTEGQYIAMLSLAYNIGIGNFRRSSVLRLTNAGAKLQAAQSFLLWNRAGGQVLKGLVRRRKAESREYLS
jgi:lysozyme